MNFWLVVLAVAVEQIIVRTLAGVYIMITRDHGRKNGEIGFERVKSVGRASEGVCMRRIGFGEHD